MKTTIFLVSLLGLMFFSGCVQSPTPALIQHNLKIPGEVVSNDVAATKTGMAKCKVILGIYSGGDCSVEAAKTAGAITKVHSVDYLVKDYFVYGTYTTIVKGE